VVPTHNRAHLLARLVAALERQTWPAADVVLVDDASTDGTEEVVDALRATARVPIAYRRMPTPAGPGVARNCGWRSTAAEVVAFIDDDCVPTPGWLEAGAAALTAEPGIGIVQGRTLPQPEVERGPWAATREVLAPSPFFEGCNLFVRRDALAASGGFDESQRIGAEDTALGWEVLARGWRRGFAEAAVVHHDTTHPGLGWHVRQAYLEGNLVPLAIRHPGLRQTFWRPWAFRSRNAAFAAALVGASLAPWKRAALGLTIPYLWINRTSRPDRTWLRQRLELALVDAAAFAGMARASLRSRRLIL
jgi:glycosyltransferase involved in cell wall biosynthesis